MDASDAEIAFYVAEADAATRPSLRDKLVEAMAKAWVAYEGDEWDDITSRGMAAVKACTERELDAALDTLEANAEQWSDEAWEQPAMAEMLRYIEALRPKWPV